MKILAIEFSSLERSVAVVNCRPGGQVCDCFEAIERGGPGTAALTMVEEALRNAHVDREEITAIAVGLGPGSYTGIRGAIALAQGWQLGRPVSLLGISSVECVAVQAQADGLNNPVAVVIDAQRGEFYLAGYDLAASPPRETQGLRLATRQEVEAALAAGLRLIGPEVTRWFSSGLTVFPRAACLGRLAAGRDQFIDGEHLEPIYLRQPSFVKAPAPRVLPW